MINYSNKRHVLINDDFSYSDADDDDYKRAPDSASLQIPHTHR